MASGREQDLKNAIPNGDDLEPDVDLAEPTRLQDKRDAKAAHDAGRAPTPDEEQAAENSAEELGDRVDEIGESVRDMTERGANLEGEGRIGG